MLRALFAKISNDIIRKILDYNTAYLPVFLLNITIQWNLNTCIHSNVMYYSIVMYI